MTVQNSRRQFLQRSAYAGAALLVSAHLPRPMAAQAAAVSQQPVALSETEWQTLEAITACIIPTDHQPGAIEANCVNFIDKALANEDSAAIPLYKAGLPAMDVAVQGEFEKDFKSLSASAQTDFLKRLERNELSDWSLGSELPSAVFFETIRMHTIIGFLSSPGYGGNRNFSGWQVVGYPGSEHHSGGYSRAQVEGKEAIEPVWMREQH